MSHDLPASFLGLLTIVKVCKTEERPGRLDQMSPLEEEIEGSKVTKIHVSGGMPLTKILGPPRFNSLRASPPQKAPSRLNPVQCLTCTSQKNTFHDICMSMCCPEQ